MLNLVLMDKTQLENIENQVYSKMAFDGCYFYTCLPRNRKIAQLALNGKMTHYYSLNRSYFALCYDSIEKCFWALSSEAKNTIFKLNLHLEEINRLHITCTESLFTDLSFNHMENTFYLCGETSILKLSKIGTILYCFKLESGMFAATTQKTHKTLFIGTLFDSPCCSVIGKFTNKSDFDYVTCLPKNFILRSFCLGYDCNNHEHLFVLASDHSQSSYLLRYEISDDSHEKDEDYLSIRTDLFL